MLYVRPAAPFLVFLVQHSVQSCSWLPGVSQFNKCARCPRHLQVPLLFNTLGSGRCGVGAMPGQLATCPVLPLCLPWFTSPH